MRRGAAMLGASLRMASAALLCVAALWIPAAAAAPMGIEDARHLLGRAGFGAAPDELRAFARMDRAGAVERLIAEGAAATRTVMPAPAWTAEPLPVFRELRDASPEERRAFMDREIRRGLELRSWWINEMLVTPSPLAERMTLFWHNHFVSAQQKVRSATLMYRQNVLLRRHALGSFGELLHAMAKDAAMLIYLDGANSRRGQPNENFARELMELFTLGEGQYSENDVREAARAFTGWSLEPRTGAFLFRRMAHDDGEKTVLGRRGRLEGDAVLDILLEQPQTARFIVAKLWREFVSPQPEADEVERIAARFRAARFDLRVALRELLGSPAFWAEANRGALIKSPVDLVVGTVRALQVEHGDPLPFALQAAGLGQNLFSPPNVKGWPGGEAWINSTTLLARRQFLERLTRVEEMPRDAREGGMQRAMGAGAAMRDAFAGARVGIGRMDEGGRERLREAVLDIRFDAGRWLTAAGLPLRASLAPLQPVNPAPEGATPREQLLRLLLDPVYQLK